MVGTALALDFLRQKRLPPVKVLAGLGITPISHSIVRKHKRQAIRDACTPQQTLHRKVGVVASLICLAVFAGLVVVAMNFTISAVFQPLFSCAVIVSFVGIAVSWMYRDSFHPGRWEIHRFNLYASAERQLPDSVIHLEH